MLETKDRRASLESVISTGMDTALKDVHTILPGEIISFDPSSQLANVQPELKKNIDGELVNLPVLSGVPIRFLKSGDFTITFPLKAGDEVAIYIVERSIDSWLETGGMQSPNDTRKFDLSDAFVVPVLYSQPQKIEDFDPNNLVIKSTNGNSKIIVKTDGSILMETTANTEITSAKTIINNDLEVTGKITAAIMEASSSLKIDGKEVGGHDHDGNVPPL